MTRISTCAGFLVPFAAGAPVAFARRGDVRAVPVEGKEGTCTVEDLLGEVREWKARPRPKPRRGSER